MFKNVSKILQILFYYLSFTNMYQFLHIQKINQNLIFSVISICKFKKKLVIILTFFVNYL